MIVIVALDDHNGMLYNRRRQSRDRELIKRMREEYDRLWMSPFSACLFQDMEDGIGISEDFLELSKPDDACFVENRALQPYEDRISKLVIYRWNRLYPGDFFFDIDVKSGKWELAGMEDFAGYSHGKITEEIYTKKEIIK